MTRDTHLVQVEPALGEAAATSVVWSVGQKWVMRITGFATVAILTRVLSPEDFGIVTVAMSIIPIIYLLADMGFGTYIMQAKHADETTLSTVFWYSAGAGATLTAALVAVAPVIGDLLDVPKATPVIYGLAPVVIVVTLGSVPNALLRRRMRFRALAVQSVIAGISSQVLAVTLAISGAGVWALVGQTFTYQIVANVFAWGTARWYPVFRFSWTEFRRIIRFGSHVLSVEVVALLRYWAENAIIVTTLGVAGLGYLNIAQRLVQVSQDLTSAAILPVSTVVFAKVRDVGDRLRSGYFKALSFTYAAVIPVILFVAVGAPLLIPLLFGSQWDESIAPAQALAVAGIMTSGAMLDQGLFYGSGRPGRWFLYALIIDGLTVAVTAALVPYGLFATAIGFVGVALVATISRWRIVGRLIELPWWRIAAPFARASLAAVGSAVAGTVAMIGSAGMPSLISLTITGVALLVVYLVITRFVMPREFDEIIRTARRLMTRLRLRLMPRRGVGTDMLAEKENVR